MKGLTAMAKMQCEAVDPVSFLTSLILSLEIFGFAAMLRFVWFGRQRHRCRRRFDGLANGAETEARIDRGGLCL